MYTTFLFLKIYNLCILHIIKREREKINVYTPNYKQLLHPGGMIIELQLLWYFY